eukprot:TRINITY_DN8309_c3_g1_i1.p1 TRINITY_DN8309_c3_g1~~TRINITY_DN8309_c3_g1_i1.p1  ORF type:complete len:439 (+),score=173.58 TRINITY_DN8309_c3_g1_i1:119-1435(+)
MMRSTKPVQYPAGFYARQTTIPPPPWRKLREQAHLQKFKQFNLRSFPWVSSQFGLLGKGGGWAWNDPKVVQSERLLKETRWEIPEMVRIDHPELPPPERREEVPPAAAAVLAAHLRGRGGGYGLAPEQLNTPVTIRSQRPELDTARNDEPRTAHARWAQYRSIELLVKVADLGLSTQARRRLEALVPELLHNGVLQIECDNYEDFWDNYEWAHTRLLQITTDARKADLDPQYWPMEQYKVREKRGRLRAVDSLRDWHKLQTESLVLGKRYADLKGKGVESVTAFQLYDTAAFAEVNYERAQKSRVEVALTGREEGYSVDALSAAMSQARQRELQADIEPEEETDETAFDEAALGGSTPRPASRPAGETEEEDDEADLFAKAAEVSRHQLKAAKLREAEPAKGRATKRLEADPDAAPGEDADAADDLLADFVAPSEDDS